MPNLFVEAFTVADGKLLPSREIVVPPGRGLRTWPWRLLQNTYKPGQKANVKIKLTGPDGKPFCRLDGLTVYDKAVEAIAGGSNVADIKESFWSWKRTPLSYRPSRASTARSEPGRAG